MITNKYAEGYPGKRYYGGCQFVDVAENLAIERAKAVWLRLCQRPAQFRQPGEPGGHDGAGSRATPSWASTSPPAATSPMARRSTSPAMVPRVRYGVRRQDGLIDYGRGAALAREHKPKIDHRRRLRLFARLGFRQFRKIADEVGAYLMVDMAHYAGLVAGRLYPSPFPHAHVVTTTTHKTLRGPRGGMVLSNDEDIAKKINSAVFPGLQGGPLMHVIAAKAVGVRRGLTPISGVTPRPSSTMRGSSRRPSRVALRVAGHRLPSDAGRLRPNGSPARPPSDLGRAGMTCNKNAIPFDPEKPTITSGVRLGTPAATTRGFGLAEFGQVGEMILETLEGLAAHGEADNAATEAKVRAEVAELTRRFPIY